MGRLQSVQVLRFAAALMVVLCHADALPLGAAGVDLFFVISGFIITRIAAGRTPGQFMRDRCLRIYPIYWLCVLPWFVFVNPLDLERSLVTVTLWPVFSDYLPPYLRPGWSLSFEMLFYVSAALVIWSRRFLPVLLTGYLAALMAGFVSDAPILRFVGSPIILEFGLGVLVAVCPGQRFAKAALTIGVIAILCALPLAHRLDNIITGLDGWRVLYVGVPSALILYGATRLEPLFKDQKLLPYLGDASYSIYLVHIYMTELLHLHWLAEVGLSLLLGVAVYRYLERPLLRVLRRAASPPLKAATAV